MVAASAIWLRDAGLLQVQQSTTISTAETQQPREFGKRGYTSHSTLGYLHHTYDMNQTLFCLPNCGDLDTNPARRRRCRLLTQAELGACLRQSAGGVCGGLRLISASSSNKSYSPTYVTLNRHVSARARVTAHLSPKLECPSTIAQSHS